MANNIQKIKDHNARREEMVTKALEAVGKIAKEYGKSMFVKFTYSGSENAYLHLNLKEMHANNPGTRVNPYQMIKQGKVFVTGDGRVWETIQNVKLDYIIVESIKDGSDEFMYSPEFLIDTPYDPEMVGFGATKKEALSDLMWTIPQVLSRLHQHPVREEILKYFREKPQ